MNGRPPSSGPTRHDQQDLVNTFKKNGMFDDLKRQIIGDFMASDAHTQVRSAVREIAEDEIAQRPDLLQQSRLNAASLLQGVIDKKSSQRSSQHEQQVYRIVKEYLDDRLLNEEIKTKVESSLREIERDL